MFLSLNEIVMSSYNYHLEYLGPKCSEVLAAAALLLIFNAHYSNLPIIIFCNIVVILLSLLLPNRSMKNWNAHCTLDI